ncbi:MAG: hypothetical protein U0414_06670 [Polyangiaceae bacterium]
MKTHTIRPTKLLAISALTVVASGCAATPKSTPAIVPETSAPSLTSTSEAPPPQPTVETISHVEAPSAGMESGRIERRLPDDTQVTPSILELREELYRLEDSDAVFARTAHFRPLCDADGYPVVGNVVRKVSGYGASSFCSELRARRDAKK